MRARITALYVLGTSLVLVVCLALLYLALDQRLRDSFDRDLVGRSDDLAAGVAAGDLAAVAADPLAQLYAADGAVLAGTPRRLLTPEQVRAVTRPETADHGKLRIRSRPVDGGRVLAVAVEADTADRVSTDLLLLLGFAAPLLVAGLAVAGWLVVRAALRPVDALTREAAAISTLDMERRLPTVPGDDEIARLASTLDAMLERLRVAFARERAFVDDASHELRTPIAVLRGELDLALDALDDPEELAQSLHAAREQTARLARLAEDLLLLARERAGTLAVNRLPVDLYDLALTEANTTAKVLGLSVRVDGTPELVEADADRLRQVLSNLAANSATAGASQARVSVRGTTLEWADDGPGFPAGLLSSAFDRFVRGDPARSASAGAGLGLSIVRAVVLAHGGTVSLRNGPPLGGAVVTVTLPRD
ncbi:two-component sensor histidine kinase [Virgisporangium aliadipatigenens]|uniref:histidine kinase n=1 Tax=Virgisporangium aliadipatigenens TaxID=741659 RepID=A0A8J3YN32_9ACTN|nr:ATP-binding protein [Virgisporangium aliadipatigenens]GIJ46851.1 two-component sensor histidine kinase [Virgisporangium aliadipatigenens]